MRSLGAAPSHAKYLLSLSFQSARWSLLFRFTRRASSLASDRAARQRVIVPEKRDLLDMSLNDSCGAITRADIQSTT